MPRDQYTFGHTTEWPREDPNGNRVTHKVQVRGTVTMGELAAELDRLGAPDAVYVANAQVTWDADATLEKLQERERSHHIQIESTRRWEVETLKRLQEKYPEIEA